MRTDPARRALARLPVLLALLALASVAWERVARGGEAPLELSFRPDGGGGGIFAIASRTGDVPRGAFVIVGLTFDGEPVRGTVRRVEVGPDGVLRMSWPTSARVAPGEYEAVALLDSAHQPRSLRGAFPGRARTFRATVYVGDPDADVAEEEAARRTLLADAAAVASLARECVDAAPLTTASDAQARSARLRLLSRFDALLDEVERRADAALPPSVFAPRYGDLEETLAATARTCRDALRAEAWHDVDRGMERPPFLDPARRGQRPFATLPEAALEAARVVGELEASRAGHAHGPRALERLARQVRRLLPDLVRGEAALGDEQQRARRALRARTESLAREQARDASAATVAGGPEVLRAVATELEELASAPAEKRAARGRLLEERVAAIEARLVQERARRHAEATELGRGLQALRDEGKRIARGDREARDAWRRSVEDLRAAVSALPDRGAELFPGVKAQLDLAARVLLAGEAAEGARATYLDSLVERALAKARSALEASSRPA